MHNLVDPLTLPSLVGQVHRELTGILARHVLGESLQEVGQTLDPPLSGLQIRNVISANPDLVIKFNTVIEHRAHWMIEEAARLATKCAKSGDVAGLKVAIDSYMKLAGKIAPKLYGDKATLELVGAGGGPIKAIVQLEPAEAYKRMLSGDVE